MTTINDVARLAGVSISTVSHVVNNTRYVSPELRSRVEAAIDALESPPNFIVKKGRPRPQGHSPGNVYFLDFGLDACFSTALRGAVIRQLAGTGYSPVLVGMDRSISLSALQLLLDGAETRGMILAADFLPETVLTTVHRSWVPTVIVGAAEAEGLDHISSNVTGGIAASVKHLLRSGHERIALLCRGEENGFCAQAYQQELSHHGVTYDPALACTGLDREIDVLAAAEHVFALETPPTALIVENHAALRTVLRFLERDNIRIPQDVSLVAVNDFDWAPLYTPPMTTVCQDAETVAREACACLLARIEYAGADPLPTRSRIVPTRLIVRGSTVGIAHGPFGEKAAPASALSLTIQDKELLRTRKYTAAISFHYTGKAFMDLISGGISEVFNALGIYLIASMDAHFDPELQCRQLESLLLMKPDIVIAFPTDNLLTASTFRRIAADTKLILMTNVPDGLHPGDYVSCLSVNERSHGRLMGQGLGEYMQRRGLQKLAIIKHNANFFGTNQRDRAAVQILTEEFPDLDVCAEVGFSSERDVYELTRVLLREHPEIEALYVSWDGPAQEVMRALEDIGRRDVAISTADLDMPVALSMAGGGMVKAISAQCPYEEGNAIGLAAATALLGRSTPSYIAVEPVKVTPENLLRSWQRIFRAEAPEELRGRYRLFRHAAASSAGQGDGADL